MGKEKEEVFLALVRAGLWENCDKFQASGFRNLWTGRKFISWLKSNLSLD